MQTRRSSRLKATNIPISTNINALKTQDNAQASNKTIKKPQAPRKRQKKLDAQPIEQPVAKFRSRRGKLRLMTEMPLDILFEIFSHLKPADVLHLAQASKSLRDILMQRSGISIWKQAFLNMPGLPPRPADLNEAQYANLLFGRHCHFCMSSGASIVFWCRRSRTCNDCLNEKFVQLSWHDDRGIIRLVPNQYIRTSRRSGKVLSLKSDVKNCREELTRLEGDSDALQLFTEEKTKFIRELMPHIQTFLNWQNEQKQYRSRELHEIRQRREKAILAKLKELGWGDELEKLWRSNGSIFLAQPAFKQAKDLTDRIWNNIRPELVEFLEVSRDARLQEERICLLRQRTKLLSELLCQYTLTRPPTEIVPLLGDVCGMEHFHAMVFDTPIETKLTEESFQELMLQLPELSAEWRESNILLLLQMIPCHKLKSKSKSKRDKSLLDLAITFFRCGWCRDPITYPRVLNHACLRSCNRSDEESNLEAEFRAACHSEPWNSGYDQVSFDTEASSYAKAIVVACEQDPDTISASAMDELDQRVECLRCIHPKRGRLVMRWRTAILHEISDHYGEPEPDSPCWQLVSENDASLAKQQEAKSASKYRAYADLSCVHCRERSGNTGYEMAHHMKHYHQIDPPNLQADTFPTPDVSMHRPPFAIRIPNPK